MLTWDQARVEILEHTELGYTLKSLDRLWAIVTVEDGRSGWAKECPEFIGNPIYLYPDGKTSCYDIWDHAAVCLSRREAEAFIASLGEYSKYWHPLNRGDETRFEHAYLNGQLPDLSGKGFTPKFKGSQGYFDLRQRIWEEMK